MATLTLTPTKNAQIQKSIGTQDTNLSGAALNQLLIVNGTGVLNETPIIRHLLTFDLSSLPNGAVVTAAVIKLYYYDQSGPTGLTFRIHKITQAWVEDQVTWNSYSAAHAWVAPGGDFGAAHADDITLPIFTPGLANTIDVFALFDWDVDVIADCLFKFALETETLYVNEADAVWDTRLNFQTSPPELVITYTGNVGSFNITVDWNNDGDFSDASENITTDVHSLAYNRGTENPDSDRAPVGTAELVVRNETGKYSPENTASVLYPNVLPRRRIQITLNGTVEWTGYIVKYIPHPANQTSYILCEDGMGWLANPDSSINAPQGAPLSGMTLDANPGPLKSILDIAGWPAADRSLDPGVDRIGPWFITNQVPRSAIEDLMQMEQSLAYIAKDGKFTYKGRHARLKGAGLVSQASFTTGLQDIDYEFSDESIINEAKVTGIERTPMIYVSPIVGDYVWGLAAPGWIAPLSSVTIWAELSDPVASITTPVSGVDYAGNQLQDGSGVDYTPSISVVATQYGQVVKLVVTNGHATQSIWVIHGTSDDVETLRIRGVVYVERELSKTELDATSQTSYQRRAIGTATKYLSSDVRLRSEAAWIVADRKDPRARFPRLHINNSTGTLLTQILTRDVGDRITVTVADLGISAKDYYINKVEHYVSEGGMLHEVVWWLDAVRLISGVEPLYWRIGTSKIGAGAGARTRVGF